MLVCLCGAAPDLGAYETEPLAATPTGGATAAGGDDGDRAGQAQREPLRLAARDRQARPGAAAQPRNWRRDHGNRRRGPRATGGTTTPR